MKFGKIIKSLLWIILLVILTVILRLGLYELTMFYSEIAANQVNNDDAYAILMSESGIRSIIWLVYSFFVLLFGWFAVKVWISKKK